MQAGFAARVLAAAFVGGAVLAGTGAAAGPRRAPEPPAAVALGRGFVDASLDTLDKGSLSLALRRAARSGRILRLLLDPYDRDSRAQAAFLTGISPTVQVRWHYGAGRPARWMDVEGLGALDWSSGRRPRFVALSPGLKRFNADWDRAALRLPRTLALNEQLQALPDPRERGPHYAHRAGGAP